MLSNYDIENICSELNIPIHGVFMKDELPSTPLNGHYIVNLESESEGNGTHWLSLSIKGLNAYHFDSFGALPNEEIINFCKKGHCRLGYNSFQIQNFNSELCGWYCIANIFVIQKSGLNNIYESANLFSNLFSAKTLANANILKQFYKKYCPMIKELNKLNNAK
jgi:hypothetical protein